jgi:chromate transporter
MTNNMNEMSFYRLFLSLHQVSSCFDHFKRDLQNSRRATFIFSLAGVELYGMNILLLYLEFACIGVFSVGGGLATLPFIYRLADKYVWLDAERIPDMLAVAQLIPGAIGVNLGAYTGFTAAGLAGAFSAAIGLITGPVAIILLIASLYNRKSLAAQKLFEGLRPAAAGLLAAAGGGLLKLSVFTEAANGHLSFKPIEFSIIVALYIVWTKFNKLPIILFIAAGAAAGIVFRL